MTGHQRARGSADLDALARLEEERDGLLRSLRRLRAEHAAGEIDDEDFAALEDDHTARAAEVMRRIEQRRAELPVAPRSSGRQRIAWIVGIVLFALVVGIVTAQATGRRTGGDTFTGDIRQTTRDLLLVARDQAAEGEVDEALQTYDEVLAIAPTNAEALAYRGWIGYTMAGRLDADEALAFLDDALASEPDYADAQVFRAIVLRDLGEIEEALAALEAVDPDAIPPFMASQVNELREELTGADQDSIDVARAAGRFREGEVLEAIAILDDVLERSPEHLEALLAKAVALGEVATQAAGDDRDDLVTRALELLERAAAVAPDDDPSPLVHRASLLAAVGRDDEALEALDELLAFEDLSPELVAEAEALRDELAGG